MNTFETFDAIYCINLSDRKDRWKDSKIEFEKVGISNIVERISGIRHIDGRVGIIKSVRKCLIKAKKENLKNVLIFEDDIKFINNPIINLNNSLEELRICEFEWDLFYLGANTHQKLEKCGNSLIRLKNAFAAHSIVYNSSIFDRVINFADTVNEIKEFNQIYDVWLSEIQKEGKTYMVNPIITTQRASYSDIERKMVDYSFIEERFKQNS